MHQSPGLTLGRSNSDGRAQCFDPDARHAHVGPDASSGRFFASSKLLKQKLLVRHASPDRLDSGRIAVSRRGSVSLPLLVPGSTMIRNTESAFTIADTSGE